MSYLTPQYRRIRFCTALYGSAAAIISKSSLPSNQQIGPGSHVPEVQLAYIKMAARYLRFCRHNRIRPARATSVLQFLRHIHENEGVQAPLATYHISAINSFLSTNNFSVPTNPELYDYICALRRQHTVVRATPATTADALAMSQRALLKRHLWAYRDFAMMLLAFASALRPTELRELTRDQLDIQAKGLRIMLPHTKSAASDPHWVTVGRAWQPARCPVRAIERWLAESGIASGVVFRAILSPKRLGPDRPMTLTRIEQIFHEYGRAVGLRGKVSAYTMRRGLASEARRRGVSKNDIREILRHQRDETTDIYIDSIPIPFERSITGLLMS